MANGWIPYMQYSRLMNEKLDKKDEEVLDDSGVSRQQIIENGWDKHATRFRKHFYDHVSGKVGGTLTQVSVIFK